MPTSSGSATSAPPWLDDAPVDPDWSPPPPPPQTEGRRVPGWVVLTTVVVAVAVLVGLVWRLGGFDRRADQRIVVEPGVLISTGPYEFTFTEATAQHVTEEYSGETYWEVVAIGSGRTTGATAIAPSYASRPMFVSRDLQLNETQLPDGQRFGDTERFGAGSSFTPGLPPKRFQVSFKFSEAYQPDPSLRFGVYQLELRDTSLLQDDEPTWANTDYVNVLDLPLKVLPEKTD